MQNSVTLQFDILGQPFSDSDLSELMKEEGQLSVQVIIGGKSYIAGQGKLTFVGERDVSNLHSSYKVGFSVINWEDSLEYKNHYEQVPFTGGDINYD